MTGFSFFALVIGGVAVAIGAVAMLVRTFASLRVRTDEDTQPMSGM
jgi:hypothetical protein